MKVFSREKYQFSGVERFKGRCYFAFKNIQQGYSEEITLVTEAKLIYPNNVGYTYFHEEELPDFFMRMKPSALPQVIPLSSLISTPRYVDSLAENESKWASRRNASKVESLTSSIIQEGEAARLGALPTTILNGILDATETVRES